MKVVGKKICRCDATLKYQEVAMVDPEIGGEEVVVRLSPAALGRFRSGVLYPREWLRLTCRIGPHYRLLSRENYSIAGRTMSSRLGRLASLVAGSAFPSKADCESSARLSVLVGVAWGGQDLGREVYGTAMRDIVAANHSERILVMVDAVASRIRQVAEIQDIINNYVASCVNRVDIDWLSRRWSKRGHVGHSSLIALSIAHMQREEVLALAQGALLRMPESRRFYETSGWRLLLQSATGQDRQSIAEFFVSNVDASHRDQAHKYISRN